MSYLSIVALEVALVGVFILLLYLLVSAFDVWA